MEVDIEAEVALKLEPVLDFYFLLSTEKVAQQKAFCSALLHLLDPALHCTEKIKIIHNNGMVTAAANATESKLTYRALMNITCLLSKQEAAFEFHAEVIRVMTCKVLESKILYYYFSRPKIYPGYFYAVLQLK